MPLDQLLVRVNRIAYREYTTNPELSDDEFRVALGRQIFGGDEANRQSTDDLLFLQDCWFSGADWFTPTLLLRPADLKRQAERENWPAERLAAYRNRVSHLRDIATRHAGSEDPNKEGNGPDCTEYRGQVGRGGQLKAQRFADSYFASASPASRIQSGSGEAYGRNVSSVPACSL
jgi:hypothetical protein